MKNMFKEDEEQEPKSNPAVIKLTPILESLDKLQKIAEEPKEVSNLDEIKLHLRNELNILMGNLKKMFGGLKIPDSFKIEGIPKYPDEVSIKDVIIQVAQLQNLLESINDLRVVLTQIDFKPKIEITHDYPDINIPPIKIPEIRIPEIKVPKAEVTVNNDMDFGDLLDALKPLRLLSDKASKPLSVRLSDGANFIKALTDIVGKQEKWVTAFSASKGMDEGEYEKKSETVFIPNKIVDGRKTVAAAGTAEQLTATSSKCKFVILVGETDNTNPVTVGNSTVVGAEATRRGIPIYAAQQVKIEINDPSKLYLDVITNGEGVTYAVFS
jgi:hypothetical protein